MTFKMLHAHDASGTYHDFVFQQTFEKLYNELTIETLKQINQILPTGTIIDYGAGTGRLSIPLSNQGYKVIAVEKSIGMIDEFREKLNGPNHGIDLHHCTISQFNNGHADLAIALFTVLSYSVTEEELSTNIQNICKHVNPKGYFFFDLPDSVFFAQESFINMESRTFKRKVDLIRNPEKDVYTYREQCSGVLNNEEFNYTEEFKIRYWELSALDKLLNENGFMDTLKTFPEFNVTGSTYKLYQKI